MATSMVPMDPNAGRNMQGTAIQGNVGAIPTGPGSNMSPVQVAGANPYIPSTPGVTGVAAPTGVVTPTGIQTNNVNWADGSHTVTGDLKDTYGAGTGNAISSVLQNLGTSTDNAVQATIANTNLAAGKQYANIQSQEAAAGISPNSSTAALASGDFYSTVNSNLQSTISNMENMQEQDLLQTLLNTGSQHGSDTSGWDTLGSIFSGLGGAVGSAAAGASSIVSSVSPAADTSWLDALGALA